MPLASNKKLSIIYILDILREYSDENHLLTQAQIADKLYSIYGLEVERKSISSNIDSLIDLDFDIIKTSNGCYLASREFEPSEIAFLIDAVFSSKSINSKHSKELAKKLSNMLSKYKRNNYKYIYKADEINRTDNKQLFYTIDVLHQAIEENKQVEFNYNRYYFDKDKNDKKKQRTYLVNPYFLINNQGKYYLVCNYDYFDEIANYKIDLITNIKIVDKPIKPITKLKGCENGIDIAKYANENIYMFHNKTVTATLQIDDEYSANYVQEWFGKNSRFFKKDDKVFAEVKANEQALVFWCLQYGEAIELASPQQTRALIKEQTLKLSERYLKNWKKINLYLLFFMYFFCAWLLLRLS